MDSGAVYEVYVDVLFGNCLVMNYLILTVTGIFLKRSATRFRRILVSVLCTGICLACLLSEIPEGLKTVLGFGVSEILALTLTFHVKAGDGLLNGVICMYLLTFLYGGCLSFGENRIPYLKEHGYTMPVLLIAGIVCYELVRSVYRRAEKSREKREKLYRVRFEWKGKEYSCIGLYDTGNQLYEPIRKLPVCVLNREILPAEAENCPDAVVPFHSLGCQNGLLYGVFVEKFRVSPFIRTQCGADEEKQALKDGKSGSDTHSTNTEKRVLLGMYRGQVSKAGEYQMILHPELFAGTDRNEAVTFIMKRGNEK